MEIVIELSDETYKDIIEENSIYGINNGLSARMTGKVVGAIQNGIPLPKGHEQLILLSKDKVKENQINLDFSCQKWISEVGLSNATVAIIEAGKMSTGDVTLFGELDDVERIKYIPMSVIEDIRAEIELQKKGFPPSSDYYKAITRAVNIIDKYRKEQEDADSN